MVQSGWKKDRALLIRGMNLFHAEALQSKRKEKANFSISYFSSATPVFGQLACSPLNLWERATLGLTIAGTIFSQAILAPDKFRAVGPTCKAARPPIMDNSQPGQRSQVSKTGKPLMMGVGYAARMSFNKSSVVTSNLVPVESQI